jgi:hypothetical protein
MDDDNGILRAVPGDYIGAASQRLPPPETAGTDSMSVVVDAGHVGRVRIDFKRVKMRHRRTSHWAWVAWRAEQTTD